MHLRKLVLVCGFATTVAANYASALGLGEVTLNSSLNQPLNADIKLLDVRDLSADQIVVTLGAPADFERNGVERLYFYSELNFEVQLNHPGGPIVHVTSRDPVREPYLNFLVEARWTSGRLLREYTLLMDLPTFADKPAAPVESATSYGQPMPQPRRSAPVKTPPRSTSSAAAEPDVRQGSGSRASLDSYGPVSSNDTLWQIALSTRPDKSMSVHQTMLAIQRLNPDAFINGNINLLRKGQVLRLPSADEVRSVSKSDAVAQVAEQNREWSGSDMGAQLTAARRDRSTSSEAQEVSGQVKLAAPAGSAAASGQGSGGNSGSGRALENKLAATLEELDKAKSENTELTSRVEDLEEQIQTMERLVNVSNEKLRAMQLAASQTNAAKTGDSTEAAMEQENSSVASEASAEVAASSAPAKVIPPKAEPAKAPARDVTKVISAPKPSLVDQLIDNILWIVLALVALVGVIYAVIRRRNENAEEPEDYAVEDDIFTPPPVDENAYESEEFEADAEQTEEMPLFDEEDVPAEAETGDVVGEADIYIAYGKLDQAEEMLLNALAKDPQSSEIRLKLLEVYAQTEDATKFDQQYAGLLPIANNAELQRASELRDSIPGIATFAGDLAFSQDAAVSESVDIAGDDEALDFSFNDEASDIDDTDAKDSLFGTNDAEPAEEDDDFTFDLDLDEEPSSSLPLDETLAHESELGRSASRYDLSFDESEADDTDETSAFSFDLEDDEENPLTVSEEAPKDTEFAEGTELSFDLEDDLDAAPLAEDVSASATVEMALAAAPEGDDFSFDFEEEPLKESFQADDKTDVKSDATLELTDDSADDFNLDMEMGDLDLEALDHEMESLDSELEDELDTESVEFVTLDESAAEPVKLDDELDEEDFNFDLDSDELEQEVDLSVVEPVEPEPENAEIAMQEGDADDDMFEQALSDLPEGDDTLADIGEVSDEDMDAELDFLADTDEAATKLDLARAYIDMGDTDGARDILSEVAQEGNEQQRNEASELLNSIDA